MGANDGRSRDQSIRLIKRSWAAAVYQEDERVLKMRTMPSVGVPLVPQGGRGPEVTGAWGGDCPVLEMLPQTFPFLSRFQEAPCARSPRLFICGSDVVAGPNTSLGRVADSISRGCVLWPCLINKHFKWLLNCFIY